MKTNLKDNIWIEGFDSRIYVEIAALNKQEDYKLMYAGKTSEVPEELAKGCVEYFIQRCKYKNYNPDKLIEGIKLNGFNYPLQSIESACESEYCIIYKTN